MWAWRKLGCLGTGLLLCAVVLFIGCTRETLQLDESFALCGVRSDELKDSTLVAPWSDSGFQPADGRDSELHLVGLSSHSGASIVTPRGCLIVPKLRPFVLVHLRESGRGFVLPSSALESRPRLARATLEPIADVPLARRCGLAETADASAWLSLTTSEGRPLLAQDLTFEPLDATPGANGVGETIDSPPNAKRVSPLGCVARSEFSAATPRLVTQKSTRLAAYLGLQESGTASLRVESALGPDFFRKCRVNPDDDVRALLSKTLSGKVDEKNRLDLLSVVGAAPADIVTANFSVCTTAGSAEGCPQSAWKDISRTAAPRQLRRVGACILASRDEGRALSSLRVSMPNGRAFFAFLEKAPTQAPPIAPLRVMEIPSAARFRETVRFEIGRCLVDPAGRVRNVHEKQSFDARLAGGERDGIAGSFVPSKLIWTAHASNGTTRQTAFPLNEPFGALPFESIGFPFGTTSSTEWVDARLEVRFPSGETVSLEEAGGCRLSPWPASVAKVDVAERELGSVVRDSLRTLEELGIDRTAPGLEDERIRYAYAFGPMAPDAGERWFADGASCLAEKGWKEVRDGIVTFLISGRFGLSIRACNPAGGSAAPWTFRASVSSSVPNFELAWIEPLQLAPVPTIGSFRAPVPFEVRDLRDDVLPWKELAANASCDVFIIDRSPVTNAALSCSLEPDRRLRVLKGRVSFATQALTDVDLRSWVGRRLRIVVRVGRDEVDRRERFLEAEIPRYVLQGYAPVVDILPDAARRMDICGTARAGDGTQYALMADGNILRRSFDGWDAFATMKSQATEFLVDASVPWQTCDPVNIETWDSVALLVISPNQKPGGVNRWLQIAELCSFGKCESLFTQSETDEKLHVLARTDNAIAGLFIDWAHRAPPRLVVRMRGQDEFELPLSDAERLGASQTAKLRFLSAGKLLTEIGGKFAIHNVADKSREDLPADLTEADDSSTHCTIPATGYFACILEDEIRILQDDKIVKFEISEFGLPFIKETQILGVQSTSDAYFIAYESTDVFVARFDLSGKLVWKRNIFPWPVDPEFDYRAYPSVFSIVDGLVTFINYRCQGVAFDTEGVMRNLSSPFGISSDRRGECAVPSIKEERVVYHSARYGLLFKNTERDGMPHDADSSAETWNEIDQRYRFLSVNHSASSLPRLLIERDDRQVTLHTFDELQTSFSIPSLECFPFKTRRNFNENFDQLLDCRSALLKIPWLNADAVDRFVYGWEKTLATQVVISASTGKDILMNKSVIRLSENERLIYASQNGILIQDKAKRLVFLRIDDHGKIERRDVSVLGEPWESDETMYDQKGNFTQGRVAMACGRAQAFHKCIAWTPEGLIGDPNVPGSAFADEDAKRWQDLTVINVAGWSGFGVSFRNEDDLVFGSFVLNDEGLLSFVERIRTKGSDSSDREITQGEMVAVGDTLLSRVSGGVWVLQNGAPPTKR